MTAYTIQIEAHGTDDIWQAIEPAETIQHDSDDPAQVAADVDANQTATEGHGYRILVWHGTDADTSSKPAADYRPPANYPYSINEIADELDTDRAALATLAEGIADDPDLYADERVSETGREILIDAANVEPGAGTLLDEGTEIAERLRTTLDHADEIRGELDAWMRKAVRWGLPKSRVADAAGVSRQTLYTAINR